MDWLNYHHLHYFWVVAREGSVARACEVLQVSQSTISGQIRELERAVKAPLFAKSGRGLVMTATGKAIFGYAENIFSLGRELMDMLRGQPVGQPLRLRVGVVDVLPKHIGYLLLKPALELEEPVRLVCMEGKIESLVSELAIHNLDLVLSDMPPPPSLKGRVFSHLLGETGVVFMGTASLVQSYRPNFPRSLNNAPFLLPTEGSTIRRGLDQWFAEQKIVPNIRAEFDDSALLKVFGRAGEGVFAIPAVTEPTVRKHYRVRRIGRAVGLREQFYAISMERKLQHPAVVAISKHARRMLSETAVPPAEAT